MTKPKARVAVTDEQIEAARSRARQFQTADRRAARVMYEKKPRKRRRAWRRGLGDKTRQCQETRLSFGHSDLHKPNQLRLI